MSCYSSAVWVLFCLCFRSIFRTFSPEIVFVIVLHFLRVFFPTIFGRVRALQMSFFSSAVWVLFCLCFRTIFRSFSPEMVFVIVLHFLRVFFPTIFGRVRALQMSFFSSAVWVLFCLCFRTIFRSFSPEMVFVLVLHFLGAFFPTIFGRVRALQMLSYCPQECQRYPPSPPLAFLSFCLCRLSVSVCLLFLTLWSVCLVGSGRPVGPIQKVPLRVSSQVKREMCDLDI